MENNTTTFRTKTGYCHVLPDRIILSSSPNPAIGAQGVTGKNIMQTLVMYGLLSLCLFYQAYNSYEENAIHFVVIFSLAGLYLLYVVFTSISNSTAPVIERKAIELVKFSKTIPGITRSHFAVFFNENGKGKKRLILLPGTLAGGIDETALAVTIMKREGLLKE